MKAARWSMGAMLAAGLVLAMLLGLALMTWKLGFAERPTTAPTLSMQWHDQVYGLDSNEVVRFVPPPFSPHRLNNLGMFAAAGPVLRQLTFQAPDRMSQPRMSQPAGTIASAMSSAGNKWVELD